VDAGEDSGADVRVVDDAGAEASVIQFVQVNAVATDPQIVSTLDVPYLMPQGAGNLSVVIVGWYNDATVDSVTDTKLNTYRLATGPTTIGTGSDRIVQSIYYASGIAAAAANENVVTVKWNKTNDGPDVRVQEYRGLDKAEPLLVAASNSGNSKSTTSGPAVVTSAPALLVAGAITGSGYSAAGTGFTVRVITEGASLGADSIVTTAGSYASTTDIQQADFWIMQLAAFR
jgi:hypothetical protein